MNLFLVITRNCNFNCIYCYEKNKKAKKDEMSFFVAKKSLNFFLPNFTASDSVHLFGGEPLLFFPKVKKIIEYIRKQNKCVTIEITTNGSLLSEDAISFLSRHKVEITLSFDGSSETQNYNRRMRGGGNSYDALVKKSYFKKIVSYPRLKVNQVISLKRVEFLALDTIHMIKLGFKNIKIEEEKGVVWSIKKIKMLKKELLEIKRHILRSGSKVKISSHIKDRLGKNSAKCDRATLAVILPDGWVYPCTVALSATKTSSLKMMKVCSVKDLSEMDNEKFFKLKEDIYLDAYDKIGIDTMFMGDKFICGSLYAKEMDMDLKNLYADELLKSEILSNSSFLSDK